MSPSSAPLRSELAINANGPFACGMPSSFSDSTGAETGGGVARAGPAQSASPAHNAAATRRMNAPSGKPDPIRIDLGPCSYTLPCPRGAVSTPLYRPVYCVLVSRAIYLRLSRNLNIAGVVCIFFAQKEDH